MIDREKVIKGLEHCSKMDGENCSKCPYQNESLGNAPTCTGHLAHDALELLKEHIVPNDMKWNPDCEDCKPESPYECQLCRQR